MIKSSKIVVVEVSGEDQYVMKRGQKVIDTKIIQMLIPQSVSIIARYPPYKTVLVISEVE